jgi:hypothetical protein
MNIINDVNPAHVSCTFNAVADSYDPIYASVLKKALPSVGNDYRYSNVVRLDSNQWLLDIDANNEIIKAGV